jgi:phosphoglycolate phosphatase
VVDTDLFVGMYPLLEELEANQIPWGIVTNKPRGLSESLLAELNLTERCAVLVCPEDVTHTKPDPEPMYLAAKQLNLDAKDIIYVGIIHVILMQVEMQRCIPFWRLTGIYQ